MIIKFKKKFKSLTLLRNSINNSVPAAADAAIKIELLFYDLKKNKKKRKKKIPERFMNSEFICFVEYAKD